MLLEMLFPEVIDFKMKISVPGLRYLPSLLARKLPDALQTRQAIAIALCCPPEQGINTVLLKTLFTWRRDTKN